jgi:hypothetical protein
MDKLLFSEEQRFGQIWMRIPLYLLAIGNIFLFGYGIYHQLIAGKSWGDNPMSDMGLIIVTCLTLAIWVGVFLLFEKSKLITKIFETEIRLRFPPFFSKEKIIPFETIKMMEVRKYNPIWEFGGWGIRYGKKGKAYNVKGNIGLQIYFKSGKSLLIGTQKMDQVKWSINKMEVSRKDTN